MNKKLAKVIMMGLLCASVLPSVGEATSTVELTQSCEFTQGASGTNYLNIKVLGNSDGKPVEINFKNPTDRGIVLLGSPSTGITMHNVSDTQDVVFNGDDILINIDSFQRDAGACAIVNDGKKLIINNGIQIGLSKSSIVNNGVMDINNGISVGLLKGVNEYSEIYDKVTIINNGELNINSAFRVAAEGVNGYNEGIAIENYGNLNINHTIKSTSVIEKEHDYDFDMVQIFGDVITHNNSETDIVLGSNEWKYVTVNNEKIRACDGNFTGALVVNEGAVVNLTINKAGVWEVSNRQESVVSGLKLNDGWVYLGSEKDAIWGNDGAIDNNKWTRLKLSNFSAVPFKNGRFTVHTDLSNNVGDRIDFLSFDNNTASSIPIDIIDKSVVGKYDMQGVLDKDFEGLIEPDEGHSVLIATTPSTSEVAINGFATYTQKGQLYDAVVNGLVDGNTKYWNFVGWEKGEDARPKDKAKQEQIDHSILVEDVEPIFKRFNDLRTDPSEVGVWIRGETGETKIRNLSYDHNVMSGGYDWERKNDAGILFTGVGFTYSTNECDDKAIGDTKGYGVNVYGSWLGKKNNDYVDLVVKYGKLDKSYAGYDENNIFVSGDYDKDLFTVSAKYGRRIFKDDWYYEPSVGLAWGKVGSANFTDNYNTPIHADASYSTIASLGMQVGKNIKGIEYYGKAEVMHDFDGKIHVSAPGRSVEDDMGGTWVKCAIGASRKIDENNSFYLEVERDFGNKVEKPYGFSAGYRFTW